MALSLIYNANSELLEGPIFDHKNELLYFVSILDGLVYCYHPKTKEILSVKLDSPASYVYLLSYKKVLVSSKDGFFKVDFKTLKTSFAFQLEIENNVRYNDGIQDAIGRIIIGTMGYPEVKKNIGKVFSYYKGESKTIIENTTISNGLAFSLDNKFLYFIDTPTKKVAKYIYNLKTGAIKFDSYVIEFKGEATPDGMCIDKNGMLWIAEWQGSCLSKWNPLIGEKIDEIALPCVNVTSCCLDNSDNLYITTAKSNHKSDNNGGSLFYYKLN